MQDALSELGFYSGEEDIEFSVFSDGTDTAVKTWQVRITIILDRLRLVGCHALWWSGLIGLHLVSPRRMITVR